MPWRWRQRCSDELQVRDRRLQGGEAVVEWQQPVPAEGDDDGLVLDRQNRRLRLARPCLAIGRRGPLLPLGDGLRVDAVALGELPQALLTMLYRSTDPRCRRGAPMVNLAHSASRHSCEKSAPPNPGIKHPLEGLTGRSSLGWGLSGR